MLNAEAEEWDKVAELLRLIHCALHAWVRIPSSSHGSFSKSTLFPAHNDLLRSTAAVKIRSTASRSSRDEKLEWDEVAEFEAIFKLHGCIATDGLISLIRRFLSSELAMGKLPGTLRSFRKNGPRWPIVVKAMDANHCALQLGLNPILVARLLYSGFACLMQKFEEWDKVAEFWRRFLRLIQCSDLVGSNLSSSSFLSKVEEWDEVAEFLRRFFKANPLCSACVGSNPVLVVRFLQQSKSGMLNAEAEEWDKVAEYLRLIHCALHAWVRIPSSSHGCFNSGFCSRSGSDMFNAEAEEWDEVAEFLRLWTANPLCSARVGSNPVLVARFLQQSKSGMLNAEAEEWDEVAEFLRKTCGPFEEGSKEEPAFPYRESNPGRLGENQES
ncbi:hypothetical protein QQF64_003164 [Cirrhinus molitorella]|uniref:Uncharacterized protein n=1 Tax=Cirrhinus molitorella TaxID=172907 RepID=A0ABR3MKU6_9TELE